MQLFVQQKDCWYWSWPLGSSQGSCACTVGSCHMRPANIPSSNSCIVVQQEWNCCDSFRTVFFAPVDTLATTEMTQHVSHSLIDWCMSSTHLSAYCVSPGCLTHFGSQVAQHWFLFMAFVLKICSWANDPCMVDAQRCTRSSKWCDQEKGPWRLLS